MVSSVTVPYLDVDAIFAVFKKEKKTFREMFAVVGIYRSILDLDLSRFAEAHESTFH